jgi:hypothetical protein
VLRGVAVAAGILPLLGGCTVGSLNIPRTGPGATRTITLRSNQNCSYFVDSRLVGKGRELQVVVENASHEIHCAADGFRTKVEYANPPFVEHYVVGFTFMLGDKLKPGEQPDIPASPRPPTAPPPVVVATDQRAEQPRPPARRREHRASLAYHQRWAAVVGINQYVDLPALEGARGDSERVATALRGRGFDDVIEIYDHEATRERILNVLGTQLARKSGPDDLVVIYFAGHGATETLPKGEKRGYILPADARADDPFSTGISMAQLRDLSARLPARQVYYVMDSCYSGLAFTRSSPIAREAPDYIDKVTSLRAVQMLTGGMEGEQTVEHGGHGLFTDFFLRALDGEADSDNDGNVTASEIGNYLRPQVTTASEGRQTPQFGTLEGSGEVVFPVGNGAARSGGAAPARR